MDKIVETEHWEQIEPYINNHTKIKYRCKHCGNIREITPKNVKNNKSTCYCIGGKRNSQEVERLCKEICKEKNYTFIEFFQKNNRKYLRYYCNKHKIENETSCKNFIEGQGCKKCGIDKIKDYLTLSEEEIKKEVDWNKDELLSYERIEEKNNTRLFLILKCKKHNCTYKSSFYHYKKGVRCSKCGYEKVAISNSKSKEENFKDFKKYEKDNEEVVDVYRDKKQKRWFGIIKCTKHGLFHISKKDYKGMGGCPKCSSSKGENKIREYLKSIFFDFIEQYKFKDCKNINPLPFDFYIPSLNIAIEYDGKQHFEVVPFSKDENKNIENFKRCQQNDKIKTQYCKDNNIKLVRIPYTEFDNIENILNKELKV